jgi:glyoxylase-like metal-dependent hydrolase (beta-lactamase superfamily II)
MKSYLDMAPEMKPQPINLAVCPGILVATLGFLLLMGCRSEVPEDGPSTSNEMVQGRGEGKDNWYDALPRAAWSEFELVEQTQPWFEVYEVAPGVLAIYEPGQFEEVISFLILGSERALLFDTGLGIGDMGRLISELTSLETIVLNSHTHYDHVGGNHQFREIYGIDNEFSRANTNGRSHEEVVEFVSEGWIWKPLPEGFSPAEYVSQPFTVTHLVSDLETIHLGGRTLEVILTPGHAPDALCLLDRENRLLFVGDTFYPASLYAHLHGSDFDRYEESAARLAELAAGVDYILPAHNEPLLKSGYLVRFSDAFQAMRDEMAPFVLTDGSREYAFEGFSIIVADPPPWAQ